VSELHRLLDDAWLEPVDKPKHEPSPGTEAGRSGPVRSNSSVSEPIEAPTQHSLLQDWGALIHQVQAAGRLSREAQTQVREQELRVGLILEEVREDICIANERARLAENKAREMQMRAESQILAAEERANAAEARARAAEERAQHAEHWLMRVHETLSDEFTDLTEQPAT
jgi:hypothetical protein